MLNVGIVQSDGDFHLIKEAEGVLLHFQSGALNTHTHMQEAFKHCWCASAAPETGTDGVLTSSSKTSLGPDLSLVSKKTVPSRPNLGMSTMMAFFLTNRTKPFSFSMPLLLKNNWKEIVCVRASAELRSCRFEDSTCVWKATEAL